jgi:hypothetical protein
MYIYKILWMYYYENLFVQTLFYFNTETSLPFVCIELQSWCSTVRCLSKVTLILEVNVGLATFKLTRKNFQIFSANAAPLYSKKSCPKLQRYVSYRLELQYS